MRTIKRYITILLMFLTIGAYAQITPLPDRYESWNHSSSESFEQTADASFTFMVSQPAIIIANTSGSNSANTSIALMGTDGIYMNAAPNVNYISELELPDEQQLRTMIRKMHSYPMTEQLAGEIYALTDGESIICVQIPSGIYTLTSMAEAVGTGAILNTNIHVHLLGDTPQDCVQLEEINSPYVYESLYWSVSNGENHNVWYKAELVEPTILDIDGVSPRGTAGKIHIYDRHMNSIYSSDDYPQKDGFFPQISPVLLPADTYYFLSESEGEGQKLIGFNVYSHTAPVSSYHSGGDGIDDPITLQTTGDTVSYSTLLDMRSFTNSFGLNSRNDAFFRFSLQKPSTLHVSSNITYGQEFYASILNEDGMQTGVLSSISSEGIDLTTGTWFIVIEGKDHDDLFDVCIRTEVREIMPPSPEPEPDPDPDPEPELIPYSPDETTNFIAVEIPVEPIMMIDSLNYKPAQRLVTYYDGYGRESQSVAFAASPTGCDLLNSYIEYDRYGRPARTWSPISRMNADARPATHNGIRTLSESFYCDSLANVYTEYAADMSGKTARQFGPGQDWQSVGKGIEFQYGSLVTRKFSVGGTRQNPILIDEGSHSPGDLYVVTETDEDGNPVSNYTDKHGHTICTQNSAGSTHYVYDNYGNLVYVLTPEASNSAISEDTINKYAYIYRYDSINRCIGKKTPGAGWEAYVLDKGDNIIFSQTSVQSGKDEWKCMLYDDFDRLVIEGIWNGTLPEMDFENHSLRAERDSSQTCGYSVDGLDIQNLCLRKVYYYDNYKFLDSIQLRLLYTYMPNPEYGERYGSDDDLIRSKGLLTGAKIYASDGNGCNTEVIYYDDRDRPIQRRRVSVSEDRMVSFHRYDFTGNEIETLEMIAVEGRGKTDSLHVQRTFDVQGRLLSERTELNGVSVTSEYGYDDIGRLEMTVATSGEVSDTTLRSYNVRGWQTDIQNDNWSAQMRYNNPLLSDSVASFTGNISEWEWTRGNSTDAYSLSYDALSRITGSRLFRNGNPVDALSESGISYDSNGNILSLTRTGESGATINDLAYTYDGNRLTSLSDGDVQSQNYAYDADGNMTFDGRTGMSLTWNDLGLVKKVSLNDTDLVNYSYLADGTKVSALDGDGDGLLYLGSLIYRKTGSNISLESAGFAGGRFVAKETSPGVSAMVPMIHVTDHLGSVRAVVDGVSGEVVETNDYYPFGSRWDVATSLKDDTNRFRYNSKEEQFNFGTPYIDYGARQYDPVLGRWFAQDPLSEKYYGISPYAFCAGNPVRYVDFYGLYFDEDNDRKSQKDERRIERKAQKLSKQAERKNSRNKDSSDLQKRSNELKKSAQDIRDMRNDPDTEYRFVKSNTPEIRAAEEKNNNGDEVIAICYNNFETRLHESRHGGQHARGEMDAAFFYGYGVMDEVDAYRAQYSWSGVYNYLYDDLSSEAIQRRINAGINPLIGTISNIDSITPAFINRLMENNTYLYPPLGIKLDYWNSH